MATEIFSKAFLEQYLADFRLSAVTDITRKKEILSNWLESSESKKLKRFKEEEIKSRFILEVFGEVLGFNYKNSHKWLVREELKTIVDATKPDAALGIFHINEAGINNDVHVVIEIKDTQSILDKPQNRQALKITPIDQAFLYASKMGGNCKWVIVSNFSQIRIYHYSSQDAYQSYTLLQLQEEDILKEFLFLFHKDRLTNTIKSATDKLYELCKKGNANSTVEKHIIDQLYDAISKFKGLNFIDPNFICNLRPFNILEDQVWHFEKGRLLTLNPQITELLREISIINDQLVLSSELLKQLQKAKVHEAKEKLVYIFQRLRDCLVKELCAVKVHLLGIKRRSIRSIGSSMRHFNHTNDNDLIVFPTKLGEDKECDCINCNYRTFDFKKFIKKVKRSETHHILEPLEEAYATYLLASDNFKKAYFIYKRADINIKGDENKNIQYFISKINQIHLYNLVEGYSIENEKDILDDIKSIDLDRSIHNELDIYADNDVRKYLIGIKENKLFLKISTIIDELAEKIEKVKNSPNDLNELSQQYQLLYSHFHKNYLVFDAFSNFETVVTKLIKALIISYQIPENGLKALTEFYLTEAILYVSREDLKKILNGIIDIELSDSDKLKLVVKAENLLQSYYNNSFFGDYEKEELMTVQLLNYQFSEKYTRLFSNTFTVLSKIELNNSLVKRLAKPILGFILLEDILGWFDIKELGKFIERYGNIFKPREFHELLKHAINYDTYGTHKYNTLIKSVAIAYYKFYPDSLIEDKSLIRRAIANATNETGRSSPQHLMPLYQIVDSSNKDLLLTELEKSFEQEFDDFLYLEMLDNNIIKWSDKDYFSKYIRAVSKSRGKGYIGLKDGQPHFKDVRMINLIYRLYLYEISPEHEELKVLQNLSTFEEWAVNPRNFDYTKFDPNWLIAVNQDFILNKLKNFSEIRKNLEQYLRQSYNALLSEIYFKYFN
ncbi:MAG: hypothetical protein WBP45_01075 [Daejeonella sp.]